MHLIGWLREHNLKSSAKVSLLGLDIYSLFRSADEVIKYLDKVDPDMALMARMEYGKLGSFKPDAFNYAHAYQEKKCDSQKDKVAHMLAEINSKAMEYIQVYGNGK